MNINTVGLPAYVLVYFDAELRNWRVRPECAGMVCDGWGETTWPCTSRSDAISLARSTWPAAAIHVELGPGEVLP